MTENDRLDVRRRAEEQKARRRAYNSDTNLSEGIVKAAGAVAVGISGAALLSRTGIGPAIERGLTFSSRFLRGTHGSSKALEDWTVTEYKQLSESAEKAFAAAKKDLDTIYLDPRDNRSLFGHLSTIRSLMDSSRHIENEFSRQEQIVKPTVDWFRSKNKTIQNIGGENAALKIENFIRNVSHNPFDRSLIYSAQKDIGALTDRRLKRTTDAIVRRVQKLDDNLKNKTRSKRRTQVGLSNIKDIVMNIENLEEHYGTVRTKKNDFFGKFMKFVQGNDRAITVGDIIKNPGDFRNIAYQTKREGKPSNRSPIDDLIDFANAGRKKNGQDWYDRFLDLTPDFSLRISHTGRMYSSEGRKKFIDELTSAAANTLPGKILKMRDINYSRIAPKFFYWMQGASDPILAALTNKDKNKKTLDNSLFRVYDKYYRLEKTGKITDLGDLGGTHLYSGKHGATQHLIHQMSGDVRYKSSSNSILKALDLFQDRSEFSGVSPLKKLNAMFGKSEDPNYIGNIINDLTDTSPEKLQELFTKASAEDSDYALEYLDKVKKLKSFLESTTYEINRDTAKAFSEVTDKNEAKIFFKTLAEGSTEDLEQLLLNTGDIHNDSLVRIANHLRTQHEETIGAIRQSISRTRENIGSSIKNTIATGYDKETLTYQQILRKEMSKEAFLRMAYDEDTGLVNYGKILNAIESTELPMRDYSEAKRLADMAIFEDRAKTFLMGTADDSSLTDKELYDEIFSIRNALAGTTKESQSLRSSLEDIKSEQLNWQTIHYSEPDEIGNPAEYNIWSTIRNTTTPLDIIRSLNDQEKFKSTTKHFFQQFYAGRNNLDDVSEMTLAPYFMLSRLSDEMNVLGLGFSKDSMGSTWDMTKAIALKRILPIAVGSTYLEWADDTSQEITGTSISGAAAQGIANVDLATRKTLDIIGATDWLKGEKSLNPIMQYWGDRNEFMDYEERKKWYASGYEPVRKGAWWTFGGVNEARGGEITYWQPSIVRRIQSDYLDKSLYDGYFDKWSHSLLPTPSNPLSPIFGILDPYWLEEKHKDDRPYLLTGEMFANGTPWGAVLNPTIGEIIKPQKDLHTFFGFEYRNVNGVDPLSLMHAINLEIKQKARDLSHTNYVQVKGDQYTPTSIKQFNAPTEDSLSESIQFKDGQVIRYERGVYGVYTPNEELNSSVGMIPTGDKKSLRVLSSIGEGEIPSIRKAIDYKIFGGPIPYQENVILTNKKDEITIVNTNGVPAMEHARSLFVKDRMEIDRQINGDFDGAKKDIATLIEKFDPRRAINVLNSATKEKASSKAFNKDDFDEAEGILSTQKLKSYKPTNAMELLNSPEAITELINAGKGSDAVRDAAISWRLVSGIYGYALGAATGFGVDDKKVIATGQDITSFSRTFWDANFGGAGGSVMEIVRRFIPDYRRGTRINPLLNEMPDWLPDRYRYSDPYCVSGDTLIEIDDLSFVEAKYVRKNNFVLTHRGNKIKVQNLAIRKIKSKEKVYKIKINTLSAVPSTFSENHPILTCTNPKAGKSGHKIQSSYKIEEQCNAVLMGLSKGVTNKRELAKLANSDIDDISRIFKKLFKDGLIEDYKDRKRCFHDIILKELRFYNPSFSKNGLCWRKAKDLNVGDYIAYPMPKKSKGIKTIIDAKNFTSYPCTDKYVYTSGQASSCFGEIYEWFESGNYKGTLAPKERKKLLEKKGWDARKFESAQNMWKNNKIPERFNRFIEISEEFSYAIGLYLAEGYNDKGLISYCLHEKEETFFNRSIKAIIEATNPSFILKTAWRKAKGTHGAQGHLYSSYISELFCYLAGKYCHSKKVPAFYWDSSEGCILKLLEGYIDGDGSTFIDKSRNKFTDRGMPTISVASVNLKMLLQFRKLLLRFNIVASISLHNKRGKIIHFPTYDSYLNENYHLIVRGKQAETLHYLLWGDYFDIEEKDIISKTPYFIRNGYLFIRISDIKEAPEIKHVYGFEVAYDNSFCVAGVATHNTLIPKGEMRLPGKGYESLNELHPDQFGDKYGAFDRMKILADIAPFTPEYRMWRDIAKKTVTDPELIQEMEEIRDRVSQQGKKHDFYDYKLVGRGLDYKNVVVSEILDYGKFRSGNTIFKIAGASVKGNAQESMQDVLGRYIHVGEKITVAVDENETYRRNNDSVGSISAAVFAGGENIGLQMIQNGDATKRKGDTSAAALLANYGPVQKGIAYASEVFAHLDVPWLSDQFLRVRSPIESYRAEQVYGTPYQSWEHPIDSFLMPAIERAFHNRTAFTGLIGTTTRILGDIPGITPGQKHALKATWLLSDRGAFIGAALSKMLSDKSGNAMKWARHGSAIATLGHFITGGNSYFDETTSGANLGQEIARIFKKNRGKGAIIGAAVGALYRAAYGDSSEWIPERTKRKWELQDYFDRLTYIKYMGLYHQAAKKAEEEEGVEIEDIFKRREKLAEKNNLAIDYFKKLKKQLQRNAPESDARNELISDLNKRIEALDTNKIVVQAGEWTRTAVIYKQAADSTMVGLKKNSTWSQLVSALPTNDREYFMEFVKERDDNRRDEILKTSSPFLRKALMLAWGKTLPKSLQIENEEFFKYHELPKKNWAGWAPQYDLKDIEVKTIENEGMMLADFGYYDSQLRDPKVRNAPTTNFSHTSRSHNMNALKKNLEDALQGNGLKDVDISIMPGPSGGFTSIVATIKHMLGMRTLQRQVDESLSMQASM